MKSKINIAIVDDEILIVQLLAEYFSRQMDINVCLTAYGGNEFLKKLNEVDIIPDVVLLDLRMKDEEGVVFARPTHDVVVFTSTIPSDVVVGIELHVGVHTDLGRAQRCDCCQRRALHGLEEAGVGALAHHARAHHVGLVGGVVSPRRVAV